MSFPRTLVIETSTAACSVALIEHDVVIAAAHEVVGRGHAERLVPMIAELPDGGRAAHILVDCGPGSFTGVRVGIAAARGLAFGWQATVHGFSALPVLAAAAFRDHPALPRLAMILEGGHGEVFAQAFEAAPLRAVGHFASLKPEAAMSFVGTMPAFGNGVRHLATLATAHPVTELLPRAADAILLPSDFTNLPPRPIYGRPPDAKIPTPRAVTA